MNEPARSVKAVSLPSGMAPSPRTTTLHRSVAGMGQLRSSLTNVKSPGNGVALSRASVHHMRPQVTSVPTRQIRRDKKTMNRRQKVPPLVPVA